MDFTVVDSFFDDFTSVQNAVFNGDFSEKVNPVDGVTYPNICMLPEWIQKEIIDNLVAMGIGEIEQKMAFARRSPKGVNVPHIVHTDKAMGGIAVMVYVNDEQYCNGGTSFVAHKETGLDATPTRPDDFATWREDHNNEERWITRCSIPMRPNRALIFNADLMHRADPVGGFGTVGRNVRTVITGFYNYKNDDFYRV